MKRKRKKRKSEDEDDDDEEDYDIMERKNRRKRRKRKKTKKRADRKKIIKTTTTTTTTTETIVDGGGGGDDDDDDDVFGSSILSGVRHQFMPDIISEMFGDVNVGISPQYNPSAPQYNPSAPQYNPSAPQYNIDEEEAHSPDEHGFVIPKEEPNEEDAPEGTDDSLKCGICLSRRVATVIEDCRHSCMCVTCARKICEKATPKCPTCRKEIKKGIKKMFI
ncbi:MAG: RING finger protein [Promethearchaeota archaeon]